MPQRSNEFQRLVNYIESQLAPVDAEVTESALLKDRVTGQDREVDILIEVDVGPRTLRVGIECTATGRPAGSTWVEGMHSKHLHLPIDKSVLVSRSGFSSPALEKAASWGIETLTFEEASDASWVKRIAETRLAYGIVDVPEIRRIEVEFDEFLPMEIEAQLDAWTSKIIRGDGSEVGTVMQFIEGAVQSQDYSSTSEFMRPGLAGFDARVDIRPDEPLYVVANQHKRMRIERILVSAWIHAEVSTVPLSPGAYKGSQIAHGAGKTENSGIEIWMLQDPQVAPTEEHAASFYVNLSSRFRGRKLRFMQRGPDGQIRDVSLYDTELN
jgi:hypothetical protein